MPSPLSMIDLKSSRSISRSRERSWVRYSGLSADVFSSIFRMTSLPISRRLLSSMPAIMSSCSARSIGRIVSKAYTPAEKSDRQVTTIRTFFPSVFGTKASSSESPSGNSWSTASIRKITGSEAAEFISRHRLSKY